MTWTFYLILTLIISVCSVFLEKKDFDLFTASVENKNINWKSWGTYGCILFSASLGLYLLPVILPVMAVKAVVKFVFSPIFNLFTKGA